MSERIDELSRAALPQGNLPQTKDQADFLTALETEGLVKRSEVGTTWHVTDKGRAELLRLLRSQNP